MHMSTGAGGCPLVPQAQPGLSKMEINPASGRAFADPTVGTRKFRFPITKETIQEIQSRFSAAWPTGTPVDEPFWCEGFATRPTLM